MEDQVSKLNGLICNDNDSVSSSDGGSGSTSSNRTTSGGRRNVAVLLGSGQADPQAKQRALNGEYFLIYVTPEKICGGGGYFLDALGAMHTCGDASKRICLIAVDESHCVSEWGHDFCKDYRNVGERIRSHLSSLVDMVDIVVVIAPFPSCSEGYHIVAPITQTLQCEAKL